jgi:hypothetical protein
MRQARYSFMMGPPHISMMHPVAFAPLFFSKREREREREKGGEGGQRIS